LPPAFTLVSFSTYFLTLKMEAIYSSETSVDFSLLATCFHTGFLLGLFVDLEDGGDAPPKRRLTLACFHTGILLGLFFYLEDGGDMFLRDVG
jgi:hypothetical protein